MVLLGNPMPHGYSNRRARSGRKNLIENPSLPQLRPVGNTIAPPNRDTCVASWSCGFGNICARAAVMFRRYNAPKP